MVANMRYRVPLTRPVLPGRRDFFERWSHVTQMTGQHSNFGLLWTEAAQRLERMTGGRYTAFPVSDGTSAVALAIWAAARECHQTPALFVEAFTFHATFCAANMVAPALCSSPIPIATDFQRHGSASVFVRTKWWGVDRDLSWSTKYDVIDAAGGFGDRRAFERVGPDSIVAVSFHATKNFPIGEGGAVLVPKHRTLAATAVRRAMCFGFNDDREPVEAFGINAKLDELRCSMLIEQLLHAQYFARRAAGIAEVTKGLADVFYKLGVVSAFTPAPGAWASLPVVAVTHDARPLVAFLGERGFQCRVTYDLRPDFDGYEEWQRECVAFPADMNADELVQLVDLIDGFYSKGGSGEHEG